MKEIKSAKSFKKVFLQLSTVTCCLRQQPQDTDFSL